MSLKYEDHSFVCDNDSSSEFPTFEQIKQDPYGNVVLRMLNHLKNKFHLKALKLRDGRIEFYLVYDNGDSSRVGSVSLKEMFRFITRNTSNPMFLNRSLDEVILILDLLEAGDEEKSS